MGLDIEIYTYDEFYEYLYQKSCDFNHFIQRCQMLPFKPNFIVVWNSSELDQEIFEWYKKEKFLGWTNKHWQCQIEFEKEEDVVYFKLRWM